MLKTLPAKQILSPMLVLAFVWSESVLAQVTLPRAPSPAAEVSQAIGILKLQSITHDQLFVTGRFGEL